MLVNGPALQAIRERSGLSQVELAKASKVSQGRISELESGVIPARPSTVKALAESLGIPLTAIIATTAQAAS